MDGYYFKLVCVDEQNPMEYCVLVDKIIGNLDEVHQYVKEHIKRYTPEITKWMLIPMRKDLVKISKPID